MDSCQMLKGLTCRPCVKNLFFFILKHIPKFLLVFFLHQKYHEYMDKKSTIVCSRKLEENTVIEILRVFLGTVPTKAVYTFSCVFFFNLDFSRHQFS